MTADIGVVGLAVMGRNLVLNMEDHGFTVAVFNRTTKTTDEFVAGDAKGRKIIGAHTLQEFAAALKRPRRALIMVRAGDAVDSTIQQLLPFFEPGDIIIDGGNSDFHDTQRRVDELKAKNILFVGMGVSGGEDGARYGPSLMPGGAAEAWPHLKTICQSICAKVGAEPCCDWVGDGGAGHFVKMVHNGIEYADMQTISETFHLLRSVLGLSLDQLAQVFTEWNKGELESFLIEITAQILSVRDTDGSPVVDKILDIAGQKGTGKWTVRESLDLGVPSTVITEAVLARFLSGLYDVRQAASKVFEAPSCPAVDATAFAEHVRQALYAAKIVCYAQGYTMFNLATRTFGWKLNNGGIALMWRGGCIIRSRFLGDIKKAFDRNPSLDNLILDPFFADELKRCVPSLRIVVAHAAMAGVPVPAFSSALAFFDGIRSARLPAYLIQAQRDYFGAHTYQRVDAPRDQAFHTNWTGHGGSVSAGVYNV